MRVAQTSLGATVAVVVQAKLRANLERLKELDMQQERR